MPAPIVPPVLQLFSASVFFGGFWTPPEDHVASDYGVGFRLGSNIPDSRWELEFSTITAKGSLRPVAFDDAASLVHLDGMYRVVDGYRVDVIAGAGVGWRHLHIDEGPVNGLSPATAFNYDVDPVMDFLGVAGAGVRVWVWGPIHLRADVHGLFLAGNEPKSEPAHVLGGGEASAGLDLRWEPPPDRDHDGVADSKDKCPNSLEDLDFYEDSDGCLDPDDDGDTIPDTQDQCKGQAEDVDGYKDSDGCLDSNNDLDILPDNLDKCPDDPESNNGWEDGDGCPDTLPADIAAIVGTPNVQFAGEGLAPGADPALMAIGNALSTHPDLVIQIAVYTDSTKGATHAKDETLAWCKAIYAWFVAHQVDVNRISFHAGGDLKPLNPDQTEPDHAQNRRMQVTILSQTGPDGQPVKFVPSPMDQWR